MGRGAGQGRGRPLPRRSATADRGRDPSADARGDLPLATSLASRAVERAGRTQAGLSALDVLCDGAIYDGRLEDTVAASDELSVLATELGDTYYAVLGRCGAVMAAAYRGKRYGDAEGLAEIDRLARRDDLPPSARGWLAYTRGEVLAGTDPGDAFAAYDEALAPAEGVGNRLLGGVALVSSCSLRARVGDVAPVAVVVRRGDPALGGARRPDPPAHDAAQPGGPPPAGRRARGRGRAARGRRPDRRADLRRGGGAPRGRSGLDARASRGRPSPPARGPGQRARDVSAAARWALEVVSSVERRSRTRSTGATSPALSAPASARNRRGRRFIGRRKKLGSWAGAAAARRARCPAADRAAS